VSTQVTQYKVLSSGSYQTADAGLVRLAYATRTSKVVPVSLEVAAALEAGRVPDVPAATLELLRKYELIIDDSGSDELAAVNNRFEAAADDLGRRHITLFPTAYCNMGCAYCGQSHQRIPLRGDHRDAVRDRVLAVLEADQTREVRLDWFGGEPLMGYATLRELAKAFVPVIDARGLIWSSVIVTNGSLLDIRKLRSLANECRVTHAEITIDGPPEVHDAHRPLKSGGTSFWRTVHAIKEALDDDSTSSMTFGIRTNVDVQNERVVEPLLRLLADEGFAHPRVRFGLKPVHSWGNDVSALELSKRSFAEHEITWFKLMRELGLNFEVLPRVPTKVLCPAVSRSSELIDPQGRVYSCSEQPLVPQVQDRTVLLQLGPRPPSSERRPLGSFDDWRDEVGAGTRQCSSCEFYATCGGSCPKLWRENHWPCPSYKVNIQERLDLIADMNGLHRRPSAAAR